MGKDVREILKTIVTTDMTGDSKGGLMLPEQADRFVDLTLDYSSMLQFVRYEKKVRNQGEIDTLNIGSVVSEGASEDPAATVDGDGEEVKPTFGKLEYTMKKIRSVFNMSTETLLDNIESQAARYQKAESGFAEPGNDFRETLMRAYARRIATDIELMAIQGDTLLASTTKLNKLLRTNDGWDKLTASGVHLVDAEYTNVSLELFAAMLEALPSPYLARINDLRWFMGPRAAIKWSMQVASRATQLGDAALKGADVAPFGIPIKMVPLIPETKTGTDGTTAFTNLSFIWLTFPENFVGLYRRQVETYWEFIPRRDRWENTTYTESDFMIENPDAIVKATNVKVDSATAYGAS